MCTDIVYHLYQFPACGVTSAKKSRQKYSIYRYRPLPESEVDIESKGVGLCRTPKHLSTSFLKHVDARPRFRPAEVARWTCRCPTGAAILKNR